MLRKLKFVEIQLETTDYNKAAHIFKNSSTYDSTKEYTIIYDSDFDTLVVYEILPK